MRVCSAQNMWKCFPFSVVLLEVHVRTSMAFLYFQKSPFDYISQKTEVIYAGQHLDSFVPFAITQQNCSITHLQLHIVHLTDVK